MNELDIAVADFETIWHGLYHSGGEWKHWICDVCRIRPDIAQALARKWIQEGDSIKDPFKGLMESAGFILDKNGYITGWHEPTNQ